MSIPPAGQEKAVVYTVDLRAKGPADSHLAKIGRLAEAIGMKNFPWKDKLVAVKTHFGERGNTVFPRPMYVRPLVDLIKAGGGKPFLAETATLYTGSRSNAPDHIETAFRHGFGPEVTGAPVFICDGLTGRDHQMVDVRGVHLQKVAVASGIHEADALVVLSHFKGHEVSGFGGAIKNLGMGCCSRSAKLLMHSSIRPSVSEKTCVRCHRCFDWCPVGAIGCKTSGGPVRIDVERCQGCGECLISCLVGAIRINWSADARGVTEKMVEHAWAVHAAKAGAAFYLNLLVDIVPLCDCYSFSDAPVVPDIGFAASTDPVALDAACLDLLEAQVGLANSVLNEAVPAGESKLARIHPKLDIRCPLSHAAALGFGSTAYERISLD